MKQLILVILFLVTYSTNVFAQNIRETSFDDRPVCEDSGGVWRQFGNGCIDECRAKLDKFSVCTQAVTGGCDCGKGRCWDGGTCVLLKDYSKIYDAEKQEEQKILDIAKKQRRKMAQQNQQTILDRISKGVSDVAKNLKLEEKSITKLQSEHSTNRIKSINSNNQSLDDSNQEPEVEIPDFFIQQQQQQKPQQVNNQGLFGKMFSSTKGEKSISEYGIANDGKSKSLISSGVNQQQNTAPPPPSSNSLPVSGLPEIALPN